MSVYVHQRDLADPPQDPMPVATASVLDLRETATTRPWRAYYSRFDITTGHRRRRDAEAELRRSGYVEVSQETFDLFQRARGIPGTTPLSQAERARFARVTATAARRVASQPDLWGPPVRLAAEIEAERAAREFSLRARACR